MFAAVKLSRRPAIAAGSFSVLAVGRNGPDYLANLAELHLAAPLEAVYFDAPAWGAAGNAQAELTAWCERHGIPAKPIGRGVAAKTFTGDSKANGAAILAEARRREIMVDDEASAEAVALFHSVFAAA